MVNYFLVLLKLPISNIQALSSNLLLLHCVSAAVSVGLHPRSPWTPILMNFIWGNNLWLCFNNWHLQLASTCCSQKYAASPDPGANDPYFR